MIESLILVISLCIDSLVASVSYSVSKIYIPKLSAVIIGLICTITLAVALLLGSIFKSFLPGNLPSILGFILLLFLGLYRLFEYIFKSYIAKKIISETPLKFKMFDFNFVLKVYSNETTADFDKSKILGTKESIYLGTALSLDSIAVGFSSSLCNINYLQVLTLCLLISFLSIYLGNLLGHKFTKIKDLEMSWISGVLLIILAFLRLL